MAQAVAISQLVHAHLNILSLVRISQTPTLFFISYLSLFIRLATQMYLNNTHLTPKAKEFKIAERQLKAQKHTFRTF